MQCKKCGEVQDDKYKFCKKCGAPLNADNECPSCGEKLEPDATFCPFCGAKVGGDNVSAVSAQSETPKRSEKVEKPEKTENGSSFYDGVAAVDISKRKPLTIGPRGQYIGAMSKAWVMVVLFFLMFGLLFLSFGKLDLSEYLSASAYPNLNLEKIEYSPIDVLGAAFSEKSSAADALREFKVDGNPLKIAFCKENMETLPFTTRVDLIVNTILVFALWLGSLTFAILFLVEALFLTCKGKSALKKDIAGLGLGIMTAIALFAMFLNGAGGGSLSAMIIGFSALALNVVYNAVVARKRLTSVKGLVTKCVSFALGITLLFTAGANHYALKMSVEKETIVSGTKQSTVTEKAPNGVLIGGIDIAINGGIDGMLENMDIPSDVIDGSLEDMLAIADMTGTDKELLALIMPPFTYFYSEMNEGYNALGVTLGILTFISYYMTGISLAVLLAFLMISLTDFKEKNSFTAHLLSLIAFGLTLVSTIICTATATSLFKIFVESGTAKCVICAAPIINVVLSTGMFLQHCILEKRKKKSVQAQ